MVIASLLAVASFIINLHVMRVFYSSRKEYWKYKDLIKDTKESNLNRNWVKFRECRRMFQISILTFMITYSVMTISILFLASVLPTAFLVNVLMILYGCYLLYILFSIIP